MVSVVLLALIAAVVSFGHMHELVIRHGETRLNATLLPLSVDGMVVASSMSLLLASRAGRRGEPLPWTLLVVGSLASLAANVEVAEPTTVGRLISAWPAQAWEWALANRSQNGQLPAGTVIARRFNRSPRWGRLVKNAGLAAHGPMNNE